MTASTSPGWRTRDTPSSARTPGNCLRAAITSRRGGMRSPACSTRTVGPGLRLYEESLLHGVDVFPQFRLKVDNLQVLHNESVHSLVRAAVLRHHAVWDRVLDQFRVVAFGLGGKCRD